MSKIFTRTFRVRWAELDPSGTVNPANYLRFVVETAWDWGVAVGWDANYSQNPDIFWLIRDVEIRFLRPLRHNDIFDLTIWLVNWHKVRGTRCFELKLKESGEVIAQGTQQIVCVDSKTGRPTNPPEDINKRLRIEDPRIFPYERFPKITAVENPFATTRHVEWMDLDTYDHVNNVIYVNYAEEIAAQELSSRGWPPARLAEENLTVITRRLRIQYLATASWGEALSISTHALGLNSVGGSRYVAIARADGTLVAECILDWELADRKSGEARALPASLR